MQFNNKQAIDILAKLHAGGFPSAIVAGGCVRDEIFGKPVKDIDVFVSYADVARWYTTDHIAHFENAIGRKVTKEDWSTYMDIPDVDSVYSVHSLTKELPVQIIVMKKGLSPVQRIDQLDFGFCQVFANGKDVFATDEFYDDLRNKTITLVHCEHQHEFDRSWVRLNRLMKKYPEFDYVIPEKYHGYV